MVKVKKLQCYSVLFFDRRYKNHQIYKNVWFNFRTHPFVCKAIQLYRMQAKIVSRTGKLYIG